MSKVAFFLQDYLNLEMINLFYRTSETRDECRIKLESIGKKIGEKLTEMFVF